jgi:hypothetical protein
MCAERWPESQKYGPACTQTRARRDACAGRIHDMQKASSSKEKNLHSSAISFPLVYTWLLPWLT